MAQSVNINRVAPAIFTANSQGTGPLAAILQRRRSDGSDSYEPLAQFKDGQFVNVPMDLGAETDRLFLSLYLTEACANKSSLKSVE